MPHKVLPGRFVSDSGSASHRARVATLVGVTVATFASSAFAQAAPPAADVPPPAAPEPPAAPVEAAPPAQPPPQPAPPEAPAAEAPPPQPAPEEPAPEPAAAEAPEEEEFKPKFTIGAGMRTGLSLIFEDPVTDEASLTLYDGLVDEVNIRPFMAGSLTPNLGYFVQFEIGTPRGLGSFAILDGIAQIKFVDELQLWVGQHLSANDRNNMNGPFFGNTWNFAIAVPSYPFDVGARDRGATLWGLIAGGVLKYHLSLVDLQPNQEIGNSRFAGRLTLHLLEPEDFYYNSGTYFGEKDVLALGAVFQHQNGSDLVDPSDPMTAVADNDFTGFSFDAFFEKNLGGGGTLTAEAGYWNFEEVGPNYSVNQGTRDFGLGVTGPHPGSAFMGVLSWLTPEKVGIGKIQPNARIQYGDYDAVDLTVFDIGLAYVIDGFNHKYHLNYRHAETEPAGAASVSEDSIQLGAQFMMSN